MNGYGDAAAAVAAYHQSYNAYGAAAGYAAAAANNYAGHAAAAYQAMQPHYGAGDHLGAGHHGSSIKHELNTGSSGSSTSSSLKIEHGGHAAGYAPETNSSTAPERHLHDDARSPTGSTGK